MNPITKAQNIAIRTFFSNITDDNVNDAYNHLYDCNDAYTTYIDDHCQGKSFQPWSRIGLESVAGMQEIVEDLINDIVSQFIVNDDNEPDDYPEDSETDDDDDD